MASGTSSANARQRAALVVRRLCQRSLAVIISTATVADPAPSLRADAKNLTAEAMAAAGAVAVI